jgi:hypothetical protein
MTDQFDGDELDDLSDWDDAGDEALDGDQTAELDLQITDSDGPPVIAELPDGSGSLVLSGAGAGTVVLADAAEAPSGTTTMASRIRSRDEALKASTPLMLVHCPHQNRDAIPRLLASVVAATGGVVSVGAAVALPLGTTTAHQGWLDRCTAASLRIADPLGYLLDPGVVRVKAISARAQRWMPYLSNDPLDMSQVLQAQRDVGANLLLSSGRALDPTNAQPSLDAAFAEADTALAELAAGERLALNLTLPAQWLINATSRSALLAQLLDQEQFDVWYIRVQWPADLRATHQPLNSKLLQGYKRLAQLALDEERTLLLPQTGLTGWLQLAFGATGFGAGPFGSGQAFKEHAQGGGGGQPPVERYFEPTLLHSVERTVHDALRAQSSYVPCNCPYCPALHSGSVWSHGLARLHHMNSMGRLAGVAAATGRTPAAAIRRTVQAATRAAARQPLAGISAPQHLSVWDQLL